jgi:hypothetical protein
VGRGSLLDRHGHEKEDFFLLAVEEIGVKDAATSHRHSETGQQVTVLQVNRCNIAEGKLDTTASPARRIRSRVGAVTQRKEELMEGKRGGEGLEKVTGWNVRKEWVRNLTHAVCVRRE